MNAPSNSIHVEVVYALATEQICIALQVPLDCTVGEAIELSGIGQRIPTLDPSTLSVGIFSKRCHMRDTLQAGDRVEIYRPLLLDPKQRRALLAQKRQR